MTYGFVTKDILKQIYIFWIIKNAIQIKIISIALLEGNLYDF